MKDETMFWYCTLNFHRTGISKYLKRQFSHFSIGKFTLKTIHCMKIYCVNILKRGKNGSVLRPELIKKVSSNNETLRVSAIYNILLTPLMFHFFFLCKIVFVFFDSFAKNWCVTEQTLLLPVIIYKWILLEESDWQCIVIELNM